MKKLTLLVFVMCFLSCKSSHSQHKPDPEAVKLNEKAFFIVNDSLFNHRADSTRLLKEALVLVNKAIQLDSNFYRAYFNKFNVQLKLRLSDSALITAKRMVLLRPQFIEPKVAAGQIYNKMGDTVNAFKYYKTAIEASDRRLASLDVNSMEYQQTKCMEGMIYIMMDQPAKGKELLKNLYDNTKNSIFKELLQQYMTMDKHDLLYGKVQHASANPIMH